jgi:acyl carrier protein
MDREKILNKLLEILAFQLNIDKERIKEGNDFRHDLGCDSLDLIEILMVSEDEFDLNVSDEIALKWKTVKLMVDYLVENVKREEYKCQGE